MPTKKAINKKMTIRALVKMWRNWNPHTLQVGMYSGADISEKCLAVPQDVKHKAVM